MCAATLCMCTLRMSYFESDAEISGVSHNREITWYEQSWHKAFKSYSEKRISWRATAGLTWKEKASVSERKKRQRCNCLHMSETSASRNGGAFCQVIGKKGQDKDTSLNQSLPLWETGNSTGQLPDCTAQGKKAAPPRLPCFAFSWSPVFLPGERTACDSSQGQAASCWVRNMKLIYTKLRMWN